METEETSCNKYELISWKKSSNFRLTYPCCGCYITTLRWGFQRRKGMFSLAEKESLVPVRALVCASRSEAESEHKVRVCACRTVSCWRPVFTPCSYPNNSPMGRRAAELLSNKTFNQRLFQWSCSGISLSLRCGWTGRPYTFKGTWKCIIFLSATYQSRLFCCLSSWVLECSASKTHENHCRKLHHVTSEEPMSELSGSDWPWVTDIC